MCGPSTLRSVVKSLCRRHGSGLTSDVVVLIGFVRFVHDGVV